MAHITKATRLQVQGLLRHDERVNEHYSNESIKRVLSNNNYNLCGNPFENYDKRMSELYVLNRKDVNTLVEIVITKPKDVSEQEQKAFFEGCLEHVEGYFGKKNMISAAVHLDETTPHIHLKAIPVYFNEKKQREQVSFDKVVKRDFYQHFHENLSKDIEKKLGHKVSILNEATIENKSVKELKLESKKKLVDEIKTLKQQQQKIVDENKKLIEKRKEIKVVHTDLIQPKKVLMKDYVPYDDYVKQFNTFKKNETQLINENEKLIERDKKINNLVGEIAKNLFTKAKDIHSFLLMNNSLYNKIATPIVNKIISDQRRTENLNRFNEAKYQAKAQDIFRAPIKTKSKGFERE